MEVWVCGAAGRSQYQVTILHTDTRPGLQHCTGYQECNREKESSPRFNGFTPRGSTVSVILLVITCGYNFYFLSNCWGLLQPLGDSESAHVYGCVFMWIPCMNTFSHGDCAPHLYQSFLHGRPIGNPPSTLEHEIRVRVAFRLAVFCQRFPLVQFLRAAGHGDEGDEKLGS